jgi:hypothetical protein
MKVDSEMEGSHDSWFLSCPLNTWHPSRKPSENRTLPPSCTGFEAILFTVHNTAIAHQSSKPPPTTLPSLGFPSVYHTQVVHPAKPRTTLTEQPLLLDSNRGIPPMQRSAVVGVVLGAVVSNLALLPGRTKTEFCSLVERWVFGSGCPSRSQKLPPCGKKRMPEIGLNFAGMLRLFRTVVSANRIRRESVVCRRLGCCFWTPHSPIFDGLLAVDHPHLSELLLLSSISLFHQSSLLDLE